MGKYPVILRADSPFDEALEILKSGGVVAYPTETFYGLGVDPFNVEAIERLYRLKGRPEKSPISVIVEDVLMLGMFTDDIPPQARRLIERYWPGPLTLVFNSLPSVPPMLLANTGKVGARVSSNAIARRLIMEWGRPLTATSANPSGKKPPVSADEVLDYFKGSIDAVIDGGGLKGGKGSTIIDVTGSELGVIREGEIPSAEIKAFLEGHS